MFESIRRNLKIIKLSMDLNWMFSHKLFKSYIVKAEISQEITRKPNSPVTIYKSIQEITEATSKLKWTEDPWSGKLDLIKHPTFMQESINSHPEYSGDCDDFAAYWCAALLKSNLSNEVYIGICFYNKGNENSGHACCVYKYDNKWFWVSNWKKCEPIEINTNKDFAKSMVEYSGLKNFLNAYLIKMNKITSTDTLIFGDTVLI